MKKLKKNHHIASLDRYTHGLVTLSSNSIWRAFSKKLVSKDAQISLGLTVRKAFHAMSNGYGDSDHLGELISAAHTGKVLAERGCGDDYIGDFQTALGYLTDCRSRALLDNTYFLLELEVPAVCEMIELYEQQLALIRQDELADAIVEGYRRSAVHF